MNNPYTIIILFIVLVTLFVFALLKLRYFINNVIYRKSPFRDTVIAKDIIIESEWTEYNVENLIDIEHDRYYIGIHLEPPYEIPLGAGGIKVLNDELINPEIKLTDENNHEYLFTLSGSRGTVVAHYDYEGNFPSPYEADIPFETFLRHRAESKGNTPSSYQGELPSNTIFQKIHIRSSRPIKAAELLWSTLDRKDLK